MNTERGVGEWKPGPNSEYNKIKKWATRRLDDFDLRLLRHLLEELRQESPHRPSPAIAGVVTSRAPEWLFQHGMRLLKSETPDERSLGTRLLRELPDPWAQTAGRELVGEELRSADPDALSWYVHAVAFLRTSGAMPTLLTFVQHPEAAVREAAAVAISACSAGPLAPEARDALIALAHDPDDEVRFSAIFELGSWWQDGLHDAVIEDSLRRAVEDRNGAVRAAAAEALGRSPA